jgi:hypothetical protein
LDFVGDLVQMDGSFHGWFEERGARGCLMNVVDDATGTTCARLGSRKPSGQRRGCCDRGSRSMGYPGRRTRTGGMSISARRRSESACKEGRPRRNLGACANGWRLALSPPVLRKRKDGGAQQRGTSRSPGKEPGQGIQSYEATNEYLEADYLPEHNRRFAREAALRAKRRRRPQRQQQRKKKGTLLMRQRGGHF